MPSEKVCKQFGKAVQRKHAYKQGKNGVGFHQRGEGDGFTALVGLFGYDANARGGRLCLLYGREVTNDGHGQIRRADGETLLPGIAHVSAAHNAGKAEGENGDQKAVKALGGGQNLQNQHLTEFGRIFAYHAGRSLTHKRGTFSGTHTGKTCRKNGAENDKEYTEIHNYISSLNL